MARPRKNAAGAGNSGSPSLSSGQASYVLDRLIAERRISMGEINRYVGEMGREISDLEARLARLREAAGNVAHAAASGVAAAGAAIVRRGRRPGRPPGSGRKPGRPGRPPGRPPANAGANAGGNAGSNASAGSTAAAPARGGKRGRRATSSITPEQLASRQLQGRYLALVRQFPESRRAAFAKTAKEKGREAAIKEMQDAQKK
jgi:hypothetical protein